jgi:hypothetical protein
MYVHPHTPAYTQSANIALCVYAGVYVCVCVCLCVFCGLIKTDMRIFMHIRMEVCRKRVCVCVHIHTHTHTYIHTCADSGGLRLGVHTYTHTYITGVHRQWHTHAQQNGLRFREIHVIFSLEHQCLVGAWTVSPRYRQQCRIREKVNIEYVCLYILCVYMCMCEYVYVCIYLLKKYIQPSRLDINALLGPGLFLPDTDSHAEFEKR